MLTAGSLADRFGRRNVFAAGLVVFTVASLVCALADSIAMLNAARVVQGIGASGLFASSLALLVNAYPETRERNGAMAIYGATIGASFAVGPLVGGALTSGLSWRWIFLINLPIGIGALAVTLRRVAESKDPAARRVDIPGQIALTGGLFLLVLALLRGNDVGWGATSTIVELAGAAVLLLSFVRIEQRVREPMLPLSLFRIPAFAGAQITVFAISASFFAVYLYATLYLQNVLGLSAIEAGLAYLPGTLIMFFVAGASAQLVEKVGPRLLIATPASAGLKRPVPTEASRKPGRMIVQLEFSVAKVIRPMPAAIRVRPPAIRARGPTFSTSWALAPATKNMISVPGR